jgi:folate-binding protein YgfZ
MSKGSFYYLHEEPGYLKISGKDRLDFLQRQTTNDLHNLSMDQPVVTVLTSPAGRILDVLWIIDEGGDSYGVLTLPGQREQTARFLNSRIFFMDKVSIETTDDFLQVDLLSDSLPGILHDLGVDGYPNEKNITHIEFNHFPIKVLTHPHLNPRFLILRESGEQAFSIFKDSELQSLSPDEYHVRRIESGLPAAGHELIEDYTPLEIGFRWAISDNKGCYTGQEVIARQVNYDKITRHLVGLKIEDMPKDKLSVFSIENGQPVGTVTSAALSPRFGPIALAVVKRPFHLPGTELRLRSSNQEMSARTNALPFT